MNVTRENLEWFPEDVSHWADFLRTTSGQRLIPKLAESAPALLAGGDVNAILIKSGELRGFQLALSTLLELTSVAPIPQRSPEAYPNLDQDEAWGPELQQPK